MALTARALPLCSVAWLRYLALTQRPGCAPGGALTFFAPAKESKQRKAAPRQRPCTPLRCASLRSGQTCDDDDGGGAAELTARCALRSDNCRESEHDAIACCAAMAQPPSSPSQALPQGVGDAGHRCARPPTGFVSLALAWGRFKCVGLAWQGWHVGACEVRRTAYRMRREACGKRAAAGMRAVCNMPPVAYSVQQGSGGAIRRRKRW